MVGHQTLSLVATPARQALLYFRFHQRTPLFVQLFLLHHAGFSIVHNFRDLVLIQFTPLILIVSSLALASLTKSLAQALLGIGLALTILIACVWLGSHLSHNSYGESSKFMEALEFFFVFAPFIFVPLWQFARRKTWTSRGILVGSFAAAYFISFIPSASHTGAVVRTRRRQRFPCPSHHSGDSGTGENTKRFAK